MRGYLGGVLRRAWTPLLLAVVAAAGAVVVWALAFQVGPTRELDGDVYAAAEGWQRFVASVVGHLLAVPMLGPVYLVLSAWALVTAWRRHGAAVAAAAAFVLVGANVVTQVLKVGTATFRPWSATDRGFYVNLASWPSGHATAAMALVLAFALAAATPSARSRVIRWGGAWAVAVAASVVWMGWHMPSDVLGGWCVAAAAGGLAVAGLRVWAAAPARRGRGAVASAQSA